MMPLASRALQRSARQLGARRTLRNATGPLLSSAAQSCPRCGFSTIPARRLAAVVSDSDSSATNSASPAGSEAKPRRKPLTEEQKTWLSSALRVNQTGELAATLIYAAQIPLLTRKEPHLRPLMKHMYDQEVGHFNTFNSLIVKHRVRPTALYPLWSVMAYGLGYATAFMNRETAMACTEAVETAIGTHYNEQIRTVLEMTSAWEAEGYEVGPEFTELLSTLRRIRDEELEHLDHALENDAQKAKPHWLLTGVIGMGCKGAIWVSERV